MLKNKLLLFVILGLHGISVAQSWPAGIHDPSGIVKHQNTYWIFGTGNGIHAMYSNDMLTWTNGPTPFAAGEFPSWILQYAKTATDQFDGFFWAPDIIYMNNQYYLYYSCSVWGTMNSCIGVVVNKTLDPADPEYAWVDQGDIGIYSSGGDINAIDPAVMRGHDGKIWLTYGSFNKDGIVVTELDSVTGKPRSGSRTSIANSYTGSGWYGEGEGGALVYRDGYYYLFYNKGGCCNGIASSYYMVMGRSENILGPYRDKNGKAMRVLSAPSGGTVVFRHDDSRGLEDRYFGPGHFGLYRENGVDYVTFHYYDPLGYYPSAEANFMGGPTLGLALLEWGEDGWPFISFDFLGEGYYTLENVNSGKVMDLKNQNTASGNVLFQYNENISHYTQRWLFTPLGTGEYTIRNYADHSMYLEAAGNDNNEILRVTNNYTDAIHQKFRLVQSPNGKLLVYPSNKNGLMEIPFAYVADYQIKLFPNTNHDCQRWYASPFVEILSVSQNNIVFEHSAGNNDSVQVTSNGSWQLTIEDPAWLQVTPSSGSGSKMLDFQFSENTSDTVRTNLVHIVSNAGNTEQMFICQKAGTTSSGPDFFKTDISIYPNPANGSVKVELPYPASIKVYSSNGTVVMEDYFNQPVAIVDLGSCAPGIYLFRITGSNVSMVRKVIRR
ncbi:MAG: family 43 glycosylhydrolase [Bacteroidales bacterium]|nr:family 43 glycosylhydrolase [Bacteroidales bacterium]MDT8431584.1 family 43 glycosylhydrolase [Bacteroidales bacterium]